ncbi:MAG: hypothetical protein CL920_00780 [Deltaproteobacteria bacterium]|nr:hypothetical protein [Deltaproteobacteria bacterium]MBU47215.1 hypothetical protein [Deltaproteobacteria bacterium]
MCKGEMKVADKKGEQNEPTVNKRDSRMMEEMAKRVGRVVCMQRERLLELPEPFAEVCREHGKKEWVNRPKPGWTRRQLEEVFTFLAEQGMLDGELSYLAMWRIEAGEPYSDQKLRSYAELIGFEIPSKKELGEVLARKRERMGELRDPLKQFVQESGFEGVYPSCSVEGWSREDIVNLTFDLVNSKLTDQEVPISQVLSLPVISRLEAGKNYSLSALRTYAYVLDADELVDHSDGHEEE